MTSYPTSTLVTQPSKFFLNDPSSPCQGPLHDMIPPSLCTHLLRRYRSWPPSTFWNFTGDIRLRFFGTAIGLGGITQPEFELGIDEIDKLIDKEGESLSDEIEAFLKSPEPPRWIPPNCATPSNREFLRNLRIPSYLNGSPSLLFHNLDVCDGNQIEEILRTACVCSYEFYFKPLLSHYSTAGSFATRQDQEKLGACWKVPRNTGPPTSLQCHLISTALASRIWQMP